MSPAPRQSTRANGPASPLAQGLGVLLFTALGLLAMVAFLQAFAPKPHMPAPVPFLGYDRVPVQAALVPEAVRRELDSFLALGSRFPGQPGHQAAAELLRQRYLAAGLTLYEQTLESPAPRTRQARLIPLAKDGAELPALPVYPFMPNHLQPMNTPAGGLTGELLLIDEHVVATCPDYRGAIGILDLKEKAPRSFEHSWVNYAQLGLQALILSHPEGMETVDWSGFSGMASANPVNFVRLAAGPEVLALAGTRVRLEVRTEYVPTPSVNLIGVLSGDTARDEALVIPVAYDAGSALPDLAPGVLPGISVAIQLRLLEALAPQRQALRRDLIFVATGSRVLAEDGLNRLLAALGRKAAPEQRANELRAELAERLAALTELASLDPVIADAEFLVTPGATTAGLARMPDAGRARFTDLAQHVLNAVVFERAEDQLQARIIFERDLTQDLTAPPYVGFQRAKQRYDKAFAAAGYPLDRLLVEQALFASEIGLRERVLARLELLRETYREQARRIEQDLALNARFASYRRVLVMAPELVPAEKPGPREALTFTMGVDANYTQEHPVVMRNHLLNAAQQLGQPGAVTVAFGGRNHGRQVQGKTQAMPIDNRLWATFSFPAFSIVHDDRGTSYRHYYAANELPFMRQLDTIATSLSVVGEAIQSAAYGNAGFEQLKTQERIPTFRGNVYASGVGQSIIPNYPVGRALIASKGWTAGRGFFPNVFFHADETGAYRYALCAGQFSADTWSTSPEAVIFGADGIISHVKDEGLSAQSIYRSLGLNPMEVDTQINLVLYRAAPVTLLDLINPQTLKAYAGADFVRQRGLSAFPSTNTFATGGIITGFIKPDERFFVRLTAGSPDNELVRTTRAFMLGTDPEWLQPGADPGTIRIGRELTGLGYLAADHPLLLGSAFEVARSMTHVNGLRLRVQNQDGYQMADERTVAFHERGLDLLHQASRPEQPARDSLLLARDAVTYATLNHPVLRQNIYEAIFGVLWYLGLLVPFVFFFEKLAFGYTDIRHQILAHLVIFLVVFGLLQWLHPAMGMIRSSLMILLGFVIMLISTGITVVFSSKFQENLEELRRQQGRVSAAEVNRLGVLATSFLLGLNNMHRRRVRTGLTCATLSLLTFVMICFTSVQSDLVDTQTAIGKAAYGGILVKNEKFRAVGEDEKRALETKYGHRFTVVARRLTVGSEDYTTRERSNPRLEVSRRLPDGQASQVMLDGWLRFSVDEPLAERLEILTQAGWFTEDMELGQPNRKPIMISDHAAAALGLRVEEVDAGEVTLKVNGDEVQVHGIFRAESLARLQDLDGRPLLPFDITALRVLNKHGNDILAEETDPLLEAGQMLLLPLGSGGFQLSQGRELISSVAVVLPKEMPYKESRQVVEQYLEQSGKSTYYGLDSYAFLGRRAREQTLAGLIEMAIPLIIAALTVLNTMKGSVYERRDEIFVYNAVGIAPHHIFFMFIAEAFVYAVVGSVLGYLLSQGTGRILMALDFTGGLNLTFTSLTTIYASLTIAASVFISTYFPALTAMRIAAPSEDQGWTLPAPEGDRLSFPVPFTFDFSDRLAVLAFFGRYFRDHGAGSSGPFFAGEPELIVLPERDGLANHGPIPALRVPIWLKPFDKGVSQTLIISVATDPETKEYIPTVTMERVSGTRETWLLLNRRFVRRLRRQFLHWRAVGREERQQLFEEARGQLAKPPKPGAHDGEGQA